MCIRDSLRARWLAGEQGQAGGAEFDRMAQSRAIAHVGRRGRRFDDLDGDGLVTMADHEEGGLVGRDRQVQQVATSPRPERGGEAAGENSQARAGLVATLRVPRKQAVVCLLYTSRCV